MRLFCLRVAHIPTVRYWERFYHSTMAAIHRPSPLFPTPSPDSAGLCLRSAGRYIEGQYNLLKSGNIPQSWMLVQGMLLAGLTMIVTAKTNRSLFPDRVGCSVLNIIEWNRQCSVVLNIMSERWADKTIAASENRFMLVANHTLKQLLNPNGGIPVSIQSHVLSHSPGQMRMADANHNELSRLMPGGSPEGQGWTVPETATHLGALTQNGNGTDIDGINLRVSLSPDSLHNARLPDQLSGEDIFGGDDLFSFWDVFPDSSEILYPT